MAQEINVGSLSRRPFMPAPLPPHLEWSETLVGALSRADRLIGRLAGEGGRLPNPHLLLRPFLRREAVLSSKIEGTQATLGDILAAEAGAVVERSPADLRKVANYVSALEFGVKKLKALPLCVRLVRDVHDKLMRGVRGGQAAPGRFRSVQNWIGAPGGSMAEASFVPPPPQAIADCLADWERFLHVSELPPLATIGLAHYQFEAIHPFLEGNGRVGRLLITLFLVERKILPAPLLYLSAYFEATRAQYYARLREVSETGAWPQWLEYFFTGVELMSEDALRRAERVNGLLEQWRRRLADASSPGPMRLVEHLAANPYITVTGAAKQLDVAYTTAQRALEPLTRQGILRPLTDAKRNRVFRADALLAILDAPAVVGADSGRRGRA